MKYQPPFLESMLDPVNGIHNTDANAPYVNGDPRIGRKGSIPPAASFEHAQREIMKVITESGQTPDHTDLEQLWKALKWLTGARLIRNVGEGEVDLYEGLDDNLRHKFRSVRAGTGISLTLEEAPDGSGEFRVVITSDAAVAAAAEDGGATPDLPACLVGVTGDLTNLSSCGSAISSSERSATYIDDYAFDDTNTTCWQPTASLPVTSNWIGWDWGSGNNATVDQATVVQFFNVDNRNDVWLSCAVEVSQDLTTWIEVARIENMTHPASNAYGPVESVTFDAYTARAFRLRGLTHQRYTSAPILVQVPNIREVQFIKQA